MFSRCKIYSANNAIQYILLWMFIKWIKPNIGLWCVMCTITVDKSNKLINNKKLKHQASHQVKHLYPYNIQNSKSYVDIRWRCSYFLCREYRRRKWSLWTPTVKWLWDWQYFVKNHEEIYLDKYSVDKLIKMENLSSELIRWIVWKHSLLE